MIIAELQKPEKRLDRWACELGLIMITILLKCYDNISVIISEKINSRMNIQKKINK